jgi:hypothetical protein
VGEWVPLQRPSIIRQLFRGSNPRAFSGKECNSGLPQVSGLKLGCFFIHFAKDLCGLVW